MSQAAERPRAAAFTEQMFSMRDFSFAMQRQENLRRSGDRLNVKAPTEQVYHTLSALPLLFVKKPKRESG